MANTYRNAFLDMTTANTTVYTVPNDSRAIIQNIQIANDLSNNINVDIYAHDSSVTTDFIIAHDQIGTKETVNLAKGPIVLEENDYLFAKAEANGSAHLTLAILEIDRNQQ
jgi:spore germination protein YaaH